MDPIKIGVGAKLYNRGGAGVLPHIATVVGFDKKHEAFGIVCFCLKNELTGELYKAPVDFLYRKVADGICQLTLKQEG